MKKYLILIILPMLVLLFTASCGGQSENAGRTVTVSIEPLRYLTERIAGDSVTVVSMVPGGSSPETYEPTPRQLMELHNSMAYLYVGQLGFERLWTERLQENAPDVTFSATSRGITGIKTLHDGHLEEDPHVWMSLPNVRILSRNILETLIKVDPEHSNGYRERWQQLELFIDSIEVVIHQIRAVRDSVSKPAFLIYHPALTYMAHDYGWEQICIEENGKEPSPTRLRSLIERGKQQDVRLIFLQQEFDHKNIESIAQELQLPTVTISPLSYNWLEEMIHIVQAVYNHERNIHVNIHSVGTFRGTSSKTRRETHSAWREHPRNIII